MESNKSWVSCRVKSTVGKNGGGGRGAKVKKRALKLDDYMMHEAYTC